MFFSKKHIPTMEEAMEFKRLGKYKKSINIYKKLIRLGKEDKFELNCNLGKVLYLDGNYINAISAFTTATNQICDDVIQSENLMKHMGAALVMAGLYPSRTEMREYLKIYYFALQDKIQLPNDPYTLKIEKVLMQMSWDYLSKQTKGAGQEHVHELMRFES